MGSLVGVIGEWRQLGGGNGRVEAAWWGVIVLCFV